MNVAFLHFHLKPGGVTRVILDQAQSCEELGYKYTILAGENLQNLPGVQVIPQLNYDGTGSDALGPQGLGQIIFQTLARAPWPQILHIHNPLLAKNSQLLPALNELFGLLAQAGAPTQILFQVHDLAEDGRPAAYSPEAYPTKVFYGFLNSRDRELFTRHCPDSRGIFLLPNRVRPLPEPEDFAEPCSETGQVVKSGQSLGPDQSKQAKNPNDCILPRLFHHFTGSSNNTIDQYLVYPVRAIPRKNIGEALALTLLLERTGIAITLPPNNPADQQQYQYWKQAAQDLNCPVAFEAGNTCTFEPLLAQAAAAVTTSVQEGFGFAFLEPWTIGLPVTGRYIPGVCQDFSQAGLKQDLLYEDLKIPVDLVDMDLFENTWVSLVQESIRIYQVTGTNDPHILQTLAQEVPGIFSQRFQGDFLDFGALTRESQTQVLQHLRQAEHRWAIRSMNPILETMETLNQWKQDRGKAILQHNRDLTLDHWGAAASAKNLERVYQTMMNSQRPGYAQKTEPVDKQGLLMDYLDPWKFMAGGR